MITEGIAAIRSTRLVSTFESRVGAMKTMKVSTIVGDLDWTTGPVPNVAKTPLTGRQWRLTDGGQFPYEIVIVSNSLAPEIPTDGKVEPLS